MSYWRWVVVQVTGRLWFWAAIYASGAILTALLAIWLTPFIPDAVSAEMGADSVEDVLSILASSMLSVATFSLATMVSAFAAGATTTTPRAAQMLVEDRTSQNAIASFIGAFLFSLVGIIALRTGLYGASGRLILFAVTLVVVLTVVVTLLKWVDHLSRLGRLDEILDRVERAAFASLSSEFATVRQPRRDVPSTAFPINIRAVGYIQFVNLERLSSIAQKAEGAVSVLRRSGAFVAPGEPVAALSWRPDEETVRGILDCFVVGATRSIEQDPRYGLIVLAEIASRALSPGVNDPGTAIDVLARIVRILVTCEAEAAANEATTGEVHVAPIAVSDIFDDVFTPIARDGAGNVEVATRLQHSLAILSRWPTYRDSARSQSVLALERAAIALTLAHDKEVVEAAAADCLLQSPEPQRHWPPAHPEN